MAYKRKRFMKPRRKFMRKRTSYKKRRLVRLIKNVSFRTHETKCNYSYSAADGLTIYHNAENTHGGYMIVHNLMATTTGTTTLERIGDSVFGRGISVRLAITLLKPNAQFRIIAYRHDPDKQTDASAADLFNTSAAGDNRLIAKFNTKDYTIVRQRFVKPIPGDWSTEVDAVNDRPCRVVNMWIPLKNRKIQYSGFNSPIVKDGAISLCVIGYTQVGELATTPIARMTVMTQFYFKDA